jgi:hypothetical protein
MIISFRSTPLLLAALACVLAGCATPKFSGVEEYKQLTKKASTAVQNAVHSLEQVSAPPGPPAPKLIDRFKRDVQNLQVDSVQIRARARAIRARGDAYFADWSDNIAKIQDPKVRAAADRSRPQLEASFSRIKSASQQAGAAFDPFLAGLQKLRVELELKPDALTGSTDQELARNTVDHGRQVLAELARIDSELRTITDLLTSRNQTVKK